ncbi:MAG: hypothetical protein ACQES2_08865 [Pseudomonadota bacterium]
MIGYKHSLQCGVNWRDNQGGLFPLSPPVLFSAVTADEARQVMKSASALFIRWESGFDCEMELPWWHIIKDAGSELSDLSGNTRSKVRRGLKVYSCVPISRDDVLKEGYEVYKQAFSRYKTHEMQYSHKDFTQVVKALPAQAEFWGVRDKTSGGLVAFSENYVEAGSCFYNTIWFDPSSLKKYSSYALFYEMNRHYLKERGFGYVSDGARNLSHATEIHDFLVAKFGFRKAYANLHVVYTPWLGLAVKLAFPLRHWIDAVPLGPFKKAGILLKQEAIRRQCEEMASL